MSSIKEIKYFISQSLSEIYQLPTFDTVEQAQASIPQDQKNSKWNCLAKYKKDGEENYRYAHISYYDCVSPVGDVADNMQWYNYSDYKNNPEAKKKFNKTNSRYR